MDPVYFFNELFSSREENDEEEFLII